MEWTLWTAAIVCFAAFALLGTFVSGRTPTRLDVEAAALRGEFTPLAAAFTAMGRWWAIAGVTLVAAAVTALVRANLWAIAGLALSQAASQAVVALAKHGFQRTRPDYWLLVHERDTSYPSGHAVTAVVFYAALALLAWRSPDLARPAAISIVAVLALFVIGLPWSRLALGAHYATDVLGGLLFGTGWLCAAIAVVARANALTR